MAFGLGFNCCCVDPPGCEDAPSDLTELADCEHCPEGPLRWRLFAGTPSWCLAAGGEHWLDYDANCAWQSEEFDCEGTPTRWYLAMGGTDRGDVILTLSANGHTVVYANTQPWLCNNSNHMTLTSPSDGMPGMASSLCLTPSTATTPPPGETCGDCPDLPVGYTFHFVPDPPLGNGTCSPDIGAPIACKIGGDYTETFESGCYWVQHVPSSGGGPLGGGLFGCNGEMRIVVHVGDGITQVTIESGYTIWATYSLEGCPVVGDNVFTFVSASAACTGWPSTITGVGIAP